MAERAVATLYGMVRSMLNSATLPEGLRNGIWAEAAKTATELKNIMSTYNSKTPPYELFHEVKYNAMDTLRTFGEMAIIIDNPRAIRSKLEDRGKIVMYMGRDPEHSADTYRFLNIRTRLILISRNVKWLNMTYDEFATVNKDKLAFLAPPAPGEVIDEDEGVTLQEVATNFAGTQTVIG